MNIPKGYKIVKQGKCLSGDIVVDQNGDIQKAVGCIGLTIKKCLGGFYGSSYKVYRCRNKGISENDCIHSKVCFVEEDRGGCDEENRKSCGLYLRQGSFEGWWKSVVDKDMDGEDDLFLKEKYRECWNTAIGHTETARFIDIVRIFLITQSYVPGKYALILLDKFVLFFERQIKVVDKD
jgi:hypothetical protein